MGRPALALGVTELPPGLSVKGPCGKDRVEVSESQWQNPWEAG